MAQVYVIYHSKYGHTKLQAEAVARGAGRVADVQAHLLTVEEATARLDELDRADAIIFGCPTFMGSMSADMKQFIEVAAKKWFTLAWKDKIGGAFTNSSGFSGDKLNTLIGLVINAMQHGMIYVGTGMMPAANEPSGPKTLAGPSENAHNRVSSFVGPMAASFEVRPPAAPGPGDIETAELYGERVATITKQFLKGRV
jgi:NAD(P)H dehydrogenase (quinone)